jgi:TolA-binding protein
MDCEKFESALIDELYGELDELTSAAAKRHIAGCARCSARIGGLRATRRVAAVPLVEPSNDLEDRILRATGRASTASPRRRWAHVLSMAGSWAMRPQTAMAAVFLVMIGTSVLLLRGRSARAPASADVTVTEQGTPAPVAPIPNPAPHVEATRVKPTAPTAAAETKPATSTKDVVSPGATPGPAAGPRAYAEAPPPSLLQSSDADQPDRLFNAALADYRAGRFSQAARAFDALAATDPNAPELWAARAIRDGNGCRAAVSRFDKTAKRYGQTPPGWDALLEGALCYRAIGELGTARARLNALLGVDSHKDRARAELERIDQLQEAQASKEPAALKGASKSRAAGATSPPPAAPAMSTEPALGAGEAPDSNR